MEGNAVTVLKADRIISIPEDDLRNGDARDGKLIGMVSRVDVLCALAQPPVRELAERAPQPGVHVKVGDVMLAQVPAVRADAPLKQVVDRIVSTAERRVVVVDEQGRALGIITDGDILKRACGERAGVLLALTGRLRGREPGVMLGRCTAAQVMTGHPVTVTSETPLLDALRLLLQHKIKRLPVADADGRLVGLVGRGEILQALARDLPGD